jgi:hypothetical protein
MTKYLFFIAYGKQDIFNECKYALLRLIAVYDSLQLAPPEVIVYTDTPGEFALFQDRLTLHLHPITAEQVRAWRGDIDFVFRPKIEMLLHVTSRYSGKLLYLDCDTYCLQPLDGLFDALTGSGVVMHNCEGSIGALTNVHIKKWRAFLKRQPGMSDALTMDMWNAGTIGFDTAFAPLLHEVLSLTDELHPKFRRHTVEQFAFGYTFQKHGLRIRSAEAYLFHYWNLKEYRVVLDHFFTKYATASLPLLLEKSVLILPEIIHPDKMAYERISSLKRRFMKWRGKDWKIQPYLRLLDE